MRPGDAIYLVYRRDQSRRILKALIAPPANPHPTAPAVDVIAGNSAVELSSVHYPLLPDGTIEVIPLCSRCHE